MTDDAEIDKGNKDASFLPAQTEKDLSPEILKANATNQAWKLAQELQYMVAFYCFRSTVGSWNKDNSGLHYCLNCEGIGQALAEKITYSFSQAVQECRSFVADTEKDQASACVELSDLLFPKSDTRLLPDQVQIKNGGPYIKIEVNDAELANRVFTDNGAAFSETVRLNREVLMVLPIIVIPGTKLLESRGLSGDQAIYQNTLAEEHEARHMEYYLSIRNFNDDEIRAHSGGDRSVTLTHAETQSRYREIGQLINMAYDNSGGDLNMVRDIKEYTALMTNILVELKGEMIAYASGMVECVPDVAGMVGASPLVKMDRHYDYLQWFNLKPEVRTAVRLDVAVNVARCTEAFMEVVEMFRDVPEYRKYSRSLGYLITLIPLENLEGWLRSETDIYDQAVLVNRLNRPVIQARKCAGLPIGSGNDKDRLNGLLKRAQQHYDNLAATIFFDESCLDVAQNMVQSNDFIGLETDMANEPAVRLVKAIDDFWLKIETDALFINLLRQSGVPIDRQLAEIGGLLPAYIGPDASNEGGRYVSIDDAITGASLAMEKLQHLFP